MSSSFAGLLRNSRIAALPQTIKSPHVVDYYPTCQAIRTTKANQSIGDWGLKRSLPNLRTKNISVAAVDTQEHQTSFKSANEYTKFVNRWQEMGLTVLGPTGYAFTSLDRIEREAKSTSAGRHLQSMSRKEANLEIIRARKLRSKFLSKQDAGTETVYTEKKLKEAQSLASQYLDLTDQEPATLHKTGGLAYHPEGSLSLINTPTGAVQKQLQARILHSGRAKTRLGLGGVVANKMTVYELDSRRGDGAQGRQTTVKVFPGMASFESSGALSINVSTKSRSRGVDSFAESRMTGKAWNPLADGLGFKRELEFEDVTASMDTTKGTSSTAVDDLFAGLGRYTTTKQRGTKKRQ